MTATPPPLPFAAVGLRFGRYALLWLKIRYQTRAVELVLVCDRDADLARKIGEEFGVPWTTDLDQVLASPIPVVALFTPPAGRADLVSRCLRAGKDVMTTKPFETDSAATVAVFAEARRLGRIIASNSPQPGLAPDLRQLDDWQHTFQLGRPVALRADATGPYFEQADGSWYDDPQRCPAAPLFRIAIYLIHDALSLLGPVDQVFVTTSRIRTGRPTPDQGVLTLRHRDGGLSAITASLCVKDGQSWRNALVINYENGTATRNLGGDPAADGANLRLITATPAGDPEITATARLHPVWSGEYDWDSFANSIRQRTPLDETFATTALEGVRVIEAMARSEATGQPVTLSRP
jgi:predicted dehydrogenase